mgnify:CR=1 FL=1
MKKTLIFTISASIVLFGLLIFPINIGEKNSVVLFFGNFHPLILHLPIGSLIGLFCLELINFFKPELKLENANKLLLWFSALSILPAVIFGFFLASSGGYNDEVLSYHKWLGWSTAFISIWLLTLRLWAYSQTKKQVKLYQLVLFVNVLLLSMAGHYGGSLTHGSNYLTKEMPGSLKNLLGVEKSESETMLSDIEELKESSESTDAIIINRAIMFADSIHPIMDNNCFECHNANKQKGDLRLDNINWKMANAETVKKWKSVYTEINEGNMPPEEEEPLSNQAKESILTWISSSLDSVKPEVIEQVAIIEKEEAAIEKEMERLAVLTKEKLASKNNSETSLKYVNEIQPILNKYCYQCHGSKKQKGDIRLDILNADMIHGGDAEKWHSALDEINAGNMPPKKKEQLTEEESRLVVDWITNNLDKAADAKSTTNKSVTRRLTKSQYTNSLNQLLELPINFGYVLPDDGKSKMGFSNNGEVLQISSLHIDYYQKIAREALDKAIVLGPKPVSKKYKITFGKGIGEGKVAAEYGGYQSAALKHEDFKVDLFDGNGINFDVTDTIKERIGIDMRGSASDRYAVENDGLILYSALPHKDVPPRSWQGPSPNAKMLIKNNYPRDGNFVLRVNASKGYGISMREGLIDLREHKAAEITPNTVHLLATDSKNTKNLELKESMLVPERIDSAASSILEIKIPSDSFYQVDLVHPYVSQDNMPSFMLKIGNFNKIEERLQLPKELEEQSEIVTPVTLAYLRKGKYKIEAGGAFFVGYKEVRFTPLTENSEIPIALKKEVQKNQEQYKDLVPSIKAFIATRTDDGMDYNTFDVSKEVTTEVGDFKTYEFTGQLENLPVPIFDPIETEPFSNTMIVGLWNNHLVKNKGENGPALLVESMELETPYHSIWPPKSHSTIFVDSPNKNNREVYTAEVIKEFMERAFRRPLITGELDRYFNFWMDIKDDFPVYEDGVKEVLVAILCSPNFLYLLESEKSTPKIFNDDYYLASKMAYFLWNSPPDETLNELASVGMLEKDLSNQIDRMIESPKTMKMIESFAYEWLRVDRLSSINIDVNMYPDFTRFVKEDMADETYNFIHYILKENKSILNFIDSDFAMLNQNLAEFYGVDGVFGNEFRPVAIPREENRGGLLSQGAFLTGHSNGKQAHPIKRAVWLKEKILGDPPPPPPPNVPELDPETPGFENLTLKEQLELHRNKVSCIDCHLKIDPYGVAFENYDAVGRFREMFKETPIDSKSVLPDGTEVEGIKGIKEYLLTQKKDEFTKSVVEHLFAYALGRDVSFSDEKELNGIVEKVKQSDYKFKSVLEEIIKSDSFLNHFNNAKTISKID